MAFCSCSCLSWITAFSRIILSCLLLIPSANADGDIFLPCVKKYSGDDVGRLKCYDQLAASAVRRNLALDENTEASATQVVLPTRNKDRSYLTKAWNLDGLVDFDASQLERFTPYRQTYVLMNSSSNPNRQPSSPTIANNVLAPADIDAAEAKFQLSFKTDIGNQCNINFLGIKTFRLWGAYTQQSNWQVFNLRNSSPLRETIFEPELIATLGTSRSSGLKLINLGWVHQSNGRAMPESRSWHRIYLLGGWEWNDTTSILVRGWQRLAENPLTDDNPDISDYFGRGDLVIRWEPSDNSQSVAMLLRNNLNKTDNRGYAQFDWATPIKLGHAARLHLQMTSGYGASLMDYNHHQNTLGVGVSFREW